MSDLGLGLTGRAVSKGSEQARPLPGAVDRRQPGAGGGGGGPLGMGERYSMCGKHIIGRDGSVRAHHTARSAQRTAHCAHAAQTTARHTFWRVEVAAGQRRGCARLSRYATPRGVCGGDMLA